MERLTEKQASEAISKLVAEAEAALTKAEMLADEHKLSFSWHGPAYGMGGYYEGNEDERSRYSEDGWSASSQSC